MIAKTIRQIGHEKDMQDIETLRSFTANMKRKDGIRKFLIPITSIAAVFVLVFSLNIYHNNRSDWNQKFSNPVFPFHISSEHIPQQSYNE